MVLPWVRLHAIKDYADLPLQLSRTPAIPHTINVVPSLLAQLDAYADGAEDVVLTLTKRPAEHLSDADRQALLAHVVVLERRTMTHDLPRLTYLLDRIDAHDTEAFTVQEWRDLQVLFSLAWTGPIHRRQAPFTTLIEKGAGFDEDEKHRMLDAHDAILRSVLPTMQRLQRDGLLELSVTPFHHPILPLLFDSDVARACMPTAPLPAPAMRVPQDADVHVTRALDDLARRTGTSPHGMWPAEGSVSMAALDCMVRHGVSWTATDEAVLQRTLGELWTPTSTFFPRRLQTPSGPIAMLFRDHDLSDAIGFTYASWDAERAAADLLRRLQERRLRIVQAHGESILEHAVVPIMLDGENCWEFYPNNGADFLDALMHALMDDARFTAVTCSQATTDVHLDAMPDLHHIMPGSWIDGTFDVWIGSPLKNMAWSLLRDARMTWESHGSAAGPEASAQAYEHLLVAEGSDWFWWYDDRHRAPHKSTFDDLFRRRLQAAYRAMSIDPPPALTRPLQEAIMDLDDTPKRVAVTYGGSAMHESDLVAKDVRLEHSGDWHRVVLALRRRPSNEESLTMIVASRDGQERACRINSDGVLWRSPLHDEGAHYLTDLEVAVYMHAAKEWRVRVEEERGSVRSFETTLS